MENPYIPLPARIDDIVVETEDGSLKTFRLVLEREADRTRWRHVPGQFAMLSLAGKGEIPIGIASAPEETGHLLFTVNRAGVVTTALHRMHPGARIGVRGPLGNGFPLDALRGKNIVIIAGGFAFTTLRAALVHLLAHRSDYGRITVIYGARTPGMLLYRKEFEAWAARDDLAVHVTVDREAPGWDGLVGFVPAVAEQVAPPPDNAAALVCGPPIMIKFTMPPLEKLGWRDEQVYLSLENRMKCGLGVCGHCTVGPATVCTDGPVFTRAEVRRLPAEY
ncbi:heterodisulfide reductase subunit F [Dissulfurirhabdus thermomarina]|uniref:Heterodisulfide reductase subunit F n=1 Tax=Dissulfurirhabdus thermomarina TaxID=1765737 RepID=A0A6N9TQP9_DISTH|nr:FAD/NAD(P)-binding protein [Dissulfurirhabdus thermomarina]NDY43601.1 heterodisulfide reductase subunit F [Dissulfurirhabdus thermomarina]NMX22460.1 heterodisulfide reductase subunit F [Dissulfurirhabdus thermomarina]